MDVFNSNGEVYENAWDLPPPPPQQCHRVEEEGRDVRAGVLHYFCYSPRVESKAQVVLGFNRHLFGHESVVCLVHSTLASLFMSQQCRQNYRRKYINLN